VSTCAAADYADEAGVTLRVGPVLTSDAFHHPDATLVPRPAAYDTFAVEMGAAGLYAVLAPKSVFASGFF